MTTENKTTMSTSLKILIIFATTLTLLFLGCMTIHTEPRTEEDNYNVNANDQDDYNDNNIMSAAQLELDRLERSLRKLNINEKTTIHDLVPEISQELSRISPEDLKTVYSKDFIGKEINVFQLPVIESSKEFFKTLWDEPEERQFLDMSDYDKKAEAFVESLKDIARMVNESVKKPHNQRSRVGLTPQSALTKEEFAKMLGFRRPKPEDSDFFQIA